MHIHHTRSVFQSSIYSRRMSHVAYCHFIVDDKRRCALFFSESANIATTYRGHIDGHAAWTSRYLRQRDTSERYIFRLLLQRSPPPPPPPPVDTCYFFISIQWRAFSLQNGNQRIVTLHYPLRSDARRRFYTLRAFFTAASGHLDEGGITRSPHGRLIIKKLRAVR